MRVILAIFLVIVFSSCKKSYKCSCRTVFNYSGGTETFLSTEKPIEKKLTEKQAKAVCDSEATALENTFNSWWTNNGTWSSGGAYARSTCKPDADF